MRDKLTLYYSVSNGGDGSAYPQFFNTEKLAQWHQDHQYEGWGESCTGEIIVEGNNLNCSMLQTKEGYYLDIFLNDEDGVNDFVTQFFPNGLPEFTVEIVDPHYYGIFVKGRLVHRHYAYPEKTANKEGVEKLWMKLVVNEENQPLGL